MQAKAIVERLPEDLRRVKNMEPNPKYGTHSNSRSKQVDQDSIRWRETARKAGVPHPQQMPWFKNCNGVFENLTSIS